jgi:hypothetical protein
MVSVISWCTKSYEHLAAGLASDCERLGYPFRLYRMDEEYPNLVRAWCNHPKIIKRAVEELGTVLFLDVECRILRPLPESWKAPLVSVRSPAQPFWIKYNTGTVLADRDCLPWLDAWVRIVDDWDMANLPADAYVYWPNDVCDELAFSAAVTALGVKLNAVALEYVDRSANAEIARGLWRNEHTVIQHPTIHHWVKELDPVECKKLFVQNFPGDPAAIERAFAEGDRRLEQDGWIFDLAGGRYAPAAHFEAHGRPWISTPVELSAAQR